MELDWTDWITFLWMLSVERTAPFISELGLPFEQERFSEVMRFARAGLEVDMFHKVGRVQTDSGRAFEQAWLDYRKAEGVLSDEALSGFAEKYAGQPEDAAQQGIYSDLQQGIGSVTANALRDWFVNKFRPRPDPV
jgi:hypothetical protein